MAKNFTCECGNDCGEMSEGRWRKGSMILCPACATRYRAMKMLLDAQKLKDNGSEQWKDLFGQDGKNPMGDLFGDLFKKR